MNEWKQKLKTLRNGRFQPDRAWVTQNRSVLLAQIQNTVKSNVHEEKGLHVATILDRISHAAGLFLPERFVQFSKSLSVASIVALVAVGGWIASVSASYDSLPGEVLYHVKVAAEKTELIVASVVGGDKDKVETLLRHASNRVEEYQKSKTSDQAAVAIRSLKKSIASTGETLKSAEAKADLTTTEVAKVVTQRTDQLLESLEAASSAPEGDHKTAETEKELGEAVHLIEVTGVKAVEVLVEQNLAGFGGISSEEVKATVEKKLEKISTDISALSNDMTVSSSLVVATSTSPTTSSTAGDIAVSSTTTKTGVIVAEAKTMIDNNDLLGAIKKVQTLTEVKNDTGTAVLEAKIMADTLTNTPTTTSKSS